MNIARLASGGRMHDLRLAIRAVWASPIVTAAAVLSLALGIGANTAIFSLVNSLLLRALPVRAPDRLVRLSTEPREGEDQYSLATYDQIRRHAQAFDGALAWSLGGGGTMMFDGREQPVDGQFVSGDFFSTLGVSALLGRTLTPADDVRGGGPDGPAAVISYGFWQRLGGSPQIVGQRLNGENAPVTIVGVLRPEFFGVIVGRSFDVYTAARTYEVAAGTPIPDDGQWLQVLLRLRPGQSLEQATAALRAVQPAIRAGSAPPDLGDAGLFLKDPFRLTPVGSGVSPLRQRFEQPLVMLLAVVGLVLVIACANIANLMLARAASRRHELSVRLALGASQMQLARQFLLESLTLASFGTMAGFAFAAWASRALVAQFSTAENPVSLDLSLDWRVLTFTTGTLITTTLLFGVAPALGARFIDPIDALKEHGRSGESGTRGHLSQGLLVAQIAMSLTLLVVAGLLVRTFDGLARASLGFDRDRVLGVTITAPNVPAAERNPFYHRLVAAAAGVPGVIRAGGSLNPPIIGFLTGDLVISEPGAAPPPTAERISQTSDITPGWLAAYGTSIRSGRDFNGRDTASAPQVMLVNESFIRRFFPGRSVIGMPLAVAYRIAHFGDVSLGSKTIVGVVADAVYRSLREPVRPTIYFPLAQLSGPMLVSSFYLAVRSATGAPAQLTRSVSAALTAVNPDLKLTFRTLDDQVNGLLAQDRLVAMLSGFFGVLALLLGALGLYGVTAYAVTRRRVEIGIRMALGATSTKVIGLVLTRVAILVAVGVLVGAGMSFWASTLVGSLLYGIQPHDPLTWVSAAALLAGAGAIAGFVPAWRASRVDPAEVLRES
jgi:putative ABC transport system permease protein